MKIVITDEVALNLERLVASTPNEFSGFGYCRKEGEDLLIYDFVKLADGTFGYTEIPVEKLLELSKRPDAANAKVWGHRHPCGNGVPGPHNWSGMDENSIQTNPLGSIPQVVGWSASIVRTPIGWVGRIDNHIKKTTIHVPVVNEWLGLISSAANKAFDDGYDWGVWGDFGEEEQDG